MRCRPSPQYKGPLGSGFRVRGLLGLGPLGGGWGLGFRVCGLGFGAFGFMVWGLWVYGLGPLGLGFGVWGLGFRVWGLGCLLQI